MYKQKRSRFVWRKKRITDSDVNSLHQKNEEPADPDLVLLNTQPVYYTISDERRLIEPVGMQSSVLSGLISYLYAERYFVDTVTAILRDLGISNIEFTSSVLAEVLFCSTHAREISMWCL